MSTAVAVNDSSSKTPINKVIALGIAIFAVIEAVVSFFLVIKPLYIKPVYDQVDAYNESGITCIVKLFGKTFASADEIASNQIILSLFSTILDIVLIYVVTTGITLLLGFCFYKGYAFAQSYLIVDFGVKVVIGLVPLLVPFANMRNSIKVYGVVDALLCLVGCAYFVYINSVEYADDMLYSSEQIAAMKSRSKSGAIMFITLAAAMVLEGLGINAFGGSWSLFLGWTSDTQIAQGSVLAILLAVAVVAAVTHVREEGWGEYFFFSFGLAVGVTNIILVVNKVIWIFKTYKPNKALANSGDEDAIAWIGNNGMTVSWWRNFIFVIIALVLALAAAFVAFRNVRKRIAVKADEGEKKAIIAVLLGAGSIVLNFALTIAAVAVWDKQLYGSASLGAMDYMYFVAYGGITLFLASALLGGFSFTKFGALALYLIADSLNFESIFVVFSARSSYVAANPGTVGYNYIIAGVLFILAFVSCFAIIPSFAVKDVDDYLYKKRYD